MNSYDFLKDQESQASAMIAQAGNIKKSYVDTTPSVQATTANRVHEVLTNAVELVVRIESIVDHLCGSVPTEVQKDAQSAPSGIFPFLDLRASDTNEAIQRAHHALDRLNKVV